jgi:hypothetical protein
MGGRGMEDGGMEDGGMWSVLVGAVCSRAQFHVHFNLLNIDWVHKARSLRIDRGFALIALQTLRTSEYPNAICPSPDLGERAVPASRPPIWEEKHPHFSLPVPARVPRMRARVRARVRAGPVPPAELPHRRLPAPNTLKCDC